MAPGFDCDLCEHDWVLGKPGTCNEEDSSCACPDGFSGRDDWFVSDTCHVNESLAVIIHQIIFISYIISSAVSFTVLVLLVRRFRDYTSNSSEPASENPTETERHSVISANAATLPRPNLDELLKRKREAEAKKQSIFTVGALLAASVFGLLYFGIFISLDFKQKASMVDSRPLLSFLYSGIAIFIFVALFFLWDSWYHTIPMNIQFAAYVGYEPFFIKHHNKIKLFNSFMIFGIPVVTLFTNLVLPEILDEPIYMRRPTIGFAINNIVILLMFLVVAVPILRNIIKAFSIAIALMKPNNSTLRSPSEMELQIYKIRKKSFEAALKTAKMFQYYICIVIGAITFLYSLFLGCQGYYQYIILNVGALTVAVTVCVFPLGIYFRTNGGLLPLFETNPELA